MSTNQAFIKAYRHDRPRVAKPASRQLPASPTSAPWHTSVEIVAPGFATASLSALSTSAGSSAVKAIGKRPLSSFAAAPGTQPPPQAEPHFEPETVISAFQWPRVCRVLWERHADQYERVADLLVEQSTREPERGGIFGVSGLASGDGCTTTLLCLAVALAARQRSVILVDGNFRAPRLARLLGVQPTTAWQDVLEQGLPVAEAVIRAERDRVDLLPLDAHDQGGSEPRGAQLAAGLQTAITAGVLRYAYEVVLVDLGAILEPGAFATISHLVRNMRIDAAVAVADATCAQADDVSLVGELLDETGCELLGVIENRAATSHRAISEI